MKRRTGSGFDAFMSYSHARDRDLAPLLQREVERFATPWYRLRSSRIFRDNANLAASSALWESIEEGLSASKWFILLASPLAAASPWVDKEVGWWLANRSPRRLVIGLTDGEFASADGVSADVLPPALRAIPFTEPRWVDLRPLREAEEIGRRAPRFVDAVADLAAAVREVPKDDLVGAHLRYHRRAMRLFIVGVLGLVVLLATSTVAAVVAVEQRNTAQVQTMNATSRQLVAQAARMEDTQPDLARQLLAEAYRLSPSTQVVGALLNSAKLPVVFPAPGLSRGVVFSPKRDILAIAGDFGVKLQDLNLPRSVAALEGSKSTSAVAFSPDDHLLATGGSDGTVRLFDVQRPESAKLVLRAPIANGGVGVLAFDPRAPVLLVLGGGVLSVLDIADPGKPRLVVQRPDFGGSDAAMALSHDARHLASSGKDSTVNLWDFSDPANPVLASSINGHSNGVTALAFSPDDGTLASGSLDDTARLWNVADPRHAVPYSTMAGPSLGISAVAYAPDGKTLATGAGDGTISLWNVSDPFRVRQQAVLPGHTDGVRVLAFTSDSRYLASGSTDGAAGDQAVGKDNSTVRVWPVAGAVRSAAMAQLPVGTFGPAFSPDGRTLAAGFPTTLWDLRDGARPARLSSVTTFNQGGQTSAFSPDGQVLATGVPALLWDVTDRGKPRSLTPEGRQEDGAKTALFSPDGKVLALAGYVTPLQLWTVSGGKPKLAGEIRRDAVGEGDVAFSPDSSLVTVAAREGLTIWNIRDLAHPERMSTITTSAGIKSAVFAGDSKTLVTGDSAGTVTVWRLSPGSPAQLVSSSSRHGGTVRSLSVYPAGHLLASADDNGSVLVWDITDPAHVDEVADLATGGHRGGQDIAFSPDGRVLAAVGESITTLWNTDAAGILGRNCAVSRPISENDWNHYLPDLPFDPPCE
ncbi:TIR domain-containing protein [Amycolatopsis balhimycina DSM 5908]|uniref:TIR domain-containing protein n=1 Tax=Amycolatopsis balhimycina DSM 5908 TaxID=1081091 RepID=A0A428WCB1_AMYBA|nr:TIR domain-containing protein [Amycolatopsis balhimycina]RSM40759.1 TIR domain-containing protein [Amycolatopsis balhimycina DSM 5908]